LIIKAENVIRKCSNLEKKNTTNLALPGCAGNLTELSRPPSWIKGKGDRGRKGKEKGKRRKGKGKVKMGNCF